MKTYNHHHLYIFGACQNFLTQNDMTYTTYMKKASCYLYTQSESVYISLIAQLSMVSSTWLFECRDFVNEALVFSVACSNTSGICCMHILDHKIFLELFVSGTNHANT